MISLQRSMHSSQIYTPGPAMSFLTCFCDFPQNEHLSRSPPSPIRATYVLPACMGPSGLTVPIGPGSRTDLAASTLPGPGLELSTPNRVSRRESKVKAAQLDPAVARVFLRLDNTRSTKP